MGSSRNRPFLTGFCPQIFNRNFAIKILFLGLRTVWWPNDPHSSYCCVLSSLAIIFMYSSVFEQLFIYLNFYVFKSQQSRDVLPIHADATTTRQNKGIHLQRSLRSVTSSNRLDRRNISSHDCLCVPSRLLQGPPLVFVNWSATTSNVLSPPPLIRPDYVPKVDQRRKTGPPQEHNLQRLCSIIQVGTSKLAFSGFSDRPSKSYTASGYIKWSRH